MTPALHAEPVRCSCGYSRTFSAEPFEGVLERVGEALAREGFGVLTTIDVRDVVAHKLGESVPAQVILGVCNAALALEAIRIDPSVSLLLPCNVAVRQEGDDVTVSIVSPRAMFSLIDAEDIEPVVAEADTRLKSALLALD